MKTLVVLMVGVLVLTSLFFSLVPSPHAQTKEEKEFMKLHEKEMTPFMEKCTKCHTIKVELRDKEMKKIFLEKCTKCHTLDRLFSKKRSIQEWHQTLEIMAGKPHANISEEELKRIEKWIDFMQSAGTVGP